jgi:hypothetical protein
MYNKCTCFSEYLICTHNSTQKFYQIFKTFSTDFLFTQNENNGNCVRSQIEIFQEIRLHFTKLIFHSHHGIYEYIYEIILFSFVAIHISGSAWDNKKI